MYFSDLMDGHLARKLNQVSELGKIIDPLADKICVITIAIILLYINKISLWFVIIVVLRDLVILAFGIYLSKKKDIRLMSNFPGKMAVLSIGVIILFSIINIPVLKSIVYYLYFLSLLLILYSSALYYLRFKSEITA